jgi:predicted PurR-regulated permease PerM
MAIIATILVFAALRLGREFLIPVAAAVLLYLALSPTIRFLARRHIPPAISAALILGLAVVGAGFGIYRVAPAARAWVAAAPARGKIAIRRLHTITAPVDQVARVVDQLSVTTNQQSNQRTVIASPQTSSRLYGTTGEIALGLGEIFVLLFALLASGDLLLQKLISVIKRSADREKAIAIARETESSISSYLFIFTAINVTEGALVAGALALIGMPSPLLWGAVVALAEFVPYIGPIAMVVLFTVAGLSTFDNTLHALLVPGVYLAIDFLQAYVATPLLMSRRLQLNPVVIFVSLALWGFLWGIPGILLAVPILATFRILCDHVESLASIGAFLGERAERERRKVLRA